MCSTGYGFPGVYSGHVFIQPRGHVIRLGIGGLFGPRVNPVVRTGIIFIVLVIGHVDARKIRDGLSCSGAQVLGARKFLFAGGDSSEAYSTAEFNQ